MKIFIRHKLGFLGSSRVKQDEDYGVYWIFNNFIKPVYYNQKTTPNLYFWTNEKDVIKVYKKLPRKLKKKVKLVE